jgi:hypothetical protein
MTEIKLLVSPVIPDRQILIDGLVSFEWCLRDDRRAFGTMPLSW